MFSKRTKWIKLSSDKEEFLNSFPSSGLKKMIIEGKAICLISHKNILFAISDRCPHQKASLSEGKITEDGFVVCPWHRYGFDSKTGRGTGYFCDTFEIKEEGKEILIGIKKGFLEI